MTLKSYNQAVNALLALGNLPIKQYMKDPRQCGIYLKRMQWLLDQLGNPEKHLRFIHIAGTSGKGSMAIMLHEILRAAGYKVGTYTSPYVSSFIERWRIGTKLINPDDITNLTNEILPIVNRAAKDCPHGQTSYFETLAAMAILHFKNKLCDWVILEAGCGGKYDATNVIPAPHVAIITNIGLDHTELLGKTRATIARRKAGIFKKGSIAIIGERDPKIAGILVKQAKLAKVKKIIKCADVKNIKISERGTLFTYKNSNLRLAAYDLRLIGDFQAQNARAAIEAARALGVSYSNITAGLSRARFPGRFEIMEQSPLIILDAAHNKDKLDSLMETIQKLYPKKTINCLVAATNNEGKDKMFDKLFAYAKTIGITEFTKSNRPVLDTQILAKRANNINPKARTRVFSQPKDGLRWAKSQTKKDEILLITGSIFLISELRENWMPEARILDKRNPFA